MSLPSARRVARELASIQAEGVAPSVYIAARGGDLTTLDALLVGPPDTPYDGAMFYFRIKVPPEYPMKPPDLRFMGTEGGSLRIHPQLYANGKVCLSILGTWRGPEWSPSLSLRIVLLSIQSLLNEEPLRCEPGLENAPLEDVERANVFVVHEATRVLILRELADVPSWGCGEDASAFTEAMHAHLADRRGPLLQKLQALAKCHDGEPLEQPFAFPAPSDGRRYDFASLAARLAELLPAKDGDETSKGTERGDADSEGSEDTQENTPDDPDPEDDSGADVPRCRFYRHAPGVLEGGTALVHPCGPSVGARVAADGPASRRRAPSTETALRRDILMPEDSARSHEAMCLWSGRPPGGAAALTGDVSHGEFEAMLLLATLQRILLTILGALALRAVMLRLAPMLSLAPPPPEEEQAVAAPFLEALGGEAGAVVLPDLAVGTSGAMHHFAAKVDAVAWAASCAAGRPSETPGDGPIGATPALAA